MALHGKGRRGRAARRTGRAANVPLTNVQGVPGGGARAGANQFAIPTLGVASPGIPNQSVRPGVPGAATGIAGNFPTPGLPQIPDLSPFRRSLGRRRRPV